MNGHDQEHVEWCAEQGIISISNPAPQIAEGFEEKMEESIEAAEVLKEEGLHEWSINAAYYAAYFALSSLLTRCGIVCKNHECSIGLLNHLFVEEDRLEKDTYDTLNDLKEQRIEKQYSITSTSESEAQRILDKARELLTDFISFRNSLNPEEVEEIRSELESMIE